MTKLTEYEMETIINYNAGEQTATLYARNKAVMRKFDTLEGGRNLMQILL